MRASRRRALRVLAAISAVCVFADPVTSALHLLEHSHRHAWCEAHQHVIHVDPDGEAVGSPEDGTALWDHASHHEHEHDECEALKVLRAELPRLVKLLSVETNDRQQLARAKPSRRTQDLLAIAPKQGPPRRG